MKWIKPKKKVPELYYKVLIRYKSGDVDFKEYHGTRDWWEQNIEEWLDETPFEEPDQDKQGEMLSEIGTLYTEYGFGNQDWDDFVKDVLKKYTITRK